MMGQHMVKCWSKSQHVVSLSSAEAELYAGVRAASEMVGLASVAKDLGIECSLVLGMDATAAIGMLQREGLGKAKHLTIQYLWLQERLRGGEIKLLKVHTSVNPADLFTKPLTEREMLRHLGRMGIEASFVEDTARSSSRWRGASTS